MKRVIFLAAVIFLTTNVRAQLTKQTSAKRVQVGEVKGFGYFIAELGYYVDESDTTYSLMFRNLKYERLVDIQHIPFKSVNGTAEKFYELLTGILNDPAKGHDYKETVTIGETMMIVSKIKSMGTYYINLYCEKGYFNLNKKQIDKLFGRN